MLQALKRLLRALHFLKVQCPDWPLDDRARRAGL